MRPAGDVLDMVRQRSAWVADRASHVRIDSGRLAEYLVDVEPAGNALGKVADGNDDAAEAAAALVIQLDAINFGSGWNPVLRKRPGRSGAITIETAYRENAERTGGFSATDLTHLTAERCARLLGQDLRGEAAELMGLYARSLRDLGEMVQSRFGGRFSAMVADAGGSAAGMVDRLCEMPLYRDVATYRGRRVPLLKRAQITVHDLATAFAGHGPGSFVDIDRLTMFADNLVPHVLRVDGILVLEPAFEKRIGRSELLLYGSPEEVELRACAVAAVERLAERTGTAPRRLDTALWRRGGLPRYKAVPRPRCRTSAY